MTDMMNIPTPAGLPAENPTRKATLADLYAGNEPADALARQEALSRLLEALQRAVSVLAATVPADGAADLLAAVARSVAAPDAAEHPVVFQKLRGVLALAVKRYWSLLRAYAEKPTVKEAWGRPDVPAGARPLAAGIPYGAWTLAALLALACLAQRLGQPLPLVVGWPADLLADLSALGWELPAPPTDEAGDEDDWDDTILP